MQCTSINVQPGLDTIDEYPCPNEAAYRLDDDPDWLVCEECMKVLESDTGLYRSVEFIDANNQSYYSDYLRRNGWKASPTISDQGAWEHPLLSLVPFGFDQGQYEAGSVRWKKGTAVALQLVHERAMHSTVSTYAGRFGTVIIKIVRVFAQLK